MIWHAFPFQGLSKAKSPGDKLLLVGIGSNNRRLFRLLLVSASEKQLRVAT
jgi:hypothetical protein